MSDQLEKNIEKVQATIGYEFKNLNLLFQAFTRKSYTLEKGIQDNEVLEHIGDSVLTMHLTRILVNEFRLNDEQSELELDFNINEQKLSKLRSKLTNNDFLSRKMTNWGFIKYVFHGSSESEKIIWSISKAKADLFEAIIGAVAIDCDFDNKTIEYVLYKTLNLNKFIENVRKKEEQSIHYQNNNSNLTPFVELKQILEKERKPQPEYTFSNDRIFDENNNLVWKCQCYIKSWNIKEEGTGETKKMAKNMAAYNILKKYFE